MKLYFQKGIKSNKDIEEIHLLDKLTYSEKYLLDIDDYKKRIERNPNQIFIVKNSMRDVVGYVSIVPLDYDSYIRIKNGETDKDVITIEKIIKNNESGQYFYFDSVIVDPAYRRYKIGKKLVGFAVNEVIKDNKDIKRIMAHAISKGGYSLCKRYGLELKKNLDKTTVVLERSFSRKAPKRKKIYKDKDKREVYKKMKVYADNY